MTHQHTPNFDFAKSIERTIEIAKVIDPLAWKHGYERPREVSLRIAAKIVNGFPELAQADALIAPEPIVIPVEALQHNPEPQKHAPNIFVRITQAWRNK